MSKWKSENAKHFEEALRTSPRWASSPAQLMWALFHIGSRLLELCSEEIEASERFSVKCLAALDMPLRNVAEGVRLHEKVEAMSELRKELAAQQERFAFLQNAIVGAWREYRATDDLPSEEVLVFVATEAQQLLREIFWGAWRESEVLSSALGGIAEIAASLSPAASEAVGY